ncbi:MAG: RNA polymerase subunit sigma-70 [Planctomycetes bacterium]|jgi:RNA polymerase sigma factor (TIGR02999 family)|nr:RNA polymerase subunit sigma-70 [Planctomycetota bacterium]
MSEFTRLLYAAEVRPPEEAEPAVGALYDELRRLARACMRGERSDHTLPPTALANEAWLRLANSQATDFASAGEFFAAAATTLRRILVEHGRRRSRQKRGGGRNRVDLPPDDLAAPQRDQQLLALDAALVRLAEVAPMKARLVELRFFAGLSVAEAANLLGLSERTVARDWRVARAFLHAELQEGNHAELLDD